MPTTGPSGTGQKLRNSCDSCNLAKVKCSKARPACARCESQGIQCIYGVSMRAGKHRATGSNITKPVPESRSSPRSTKPSSKESSPVQPFSPDERAQPYDPSFTSIIDSMPMNGDWSSVLRDECNPYLIGNVMDLDNSALKQRHYSGAFSDKDFLPNPADICMDPTLVPQDIFAAKSFSDSSNSRPMTASTLLSEPQHSPSSTSPMSNCNCDQKVLQQLLSLTRIPDVPAAFDTALNQNKQVIAFCRSILADRTHHHHDISFVLTLTALIAKVIAVYDAIYNPFNSQGSSPTAQHLHQQPFATEPHMFSDIDMGSADTMSGLDFSGGPRCINPSNTTNTPTLQSSPFSSSASLSGLSSPISATYPVRLTLGNYRLDEKDEEKLKWDIFKIELSKVSALVKAFEQKFCNGPGGVAQSQSKFEAKAYEDMVYYLQKRLRVSLEMPREATLAGLGQIAPVTYA